jgi:hypothetical protein
MEPPDTCLGCGRPPLWPAPTQLGARAAPAWSSRPCACPPPRDCLARAPPNSPGAPPWESGPSLPPLSATIVCAPASPTPGMVSSSPTASATTGAGRSSSACRMWASTRAQAAASSSYRASNAPNTHRWGPAGVLRARGLTPAFSASSSGAPRPSSPWQRPRLPLAPAESCHSRSPAGADWPRRSGRAGHCADSGSVPVEHG